MELSFIWVEKFNSLVNFSLNLSNKYKYEYDAETNFLSRVDDSPLPKDFFGSGITSVTGIFGKNGSGKTNCLKLIGSVMSRARSRVGSDFIAIVESDDGPFIYCKFKGRDRLGPALDFPGNIREYKDDIRGLNTVFLSNTFDSADMGFDKKIINLSIANREKKGDEFIDIVDFLHAKEVGDGFTMPKEISATVKPIKIKDIKSVIESIEPKLINEKKDQVDFLIKGFENCFERINNNFRRNCTFRDVQFAISVNEIISLLKVVCKRENSSGSVLGHLESILNSIDEHGSTIRTLISSLHSMVDLIDYNYENNEDDSEYKAGKANIHDLIGNLQSIDDWSADRFSDIFKVGNITYSAVSGFKFKLTIDYSSDEVQYNIYALHKYAKLSFLDISSGQKAILGILSSIYVQVKNKRNATLIMLDEADLYLHPEWQLLFMKKMIEILSSLNRSNVQIIVTSHSPLIMTDFPQRCLVLLENKNGLTNKKKNNFNPFGANLYELYSQGFFLTESKVGALAFEKIMSLLSEIKDSKKGQPLNEEFYLTLDLIADEVSKNEIKRLVKNYDKNC